MSTEKLLDLAEAAELLGVHPSTLRRWADVGKVAHIRTLSGRRRFSPSAILQAKNEMAHPSAWIESGQFELKTLSLARQKTSEQQPQHGNLMAQLSEDQRLLFRYSGQRLLGVMLQFISRSGSAEKFLEEGQRITSDYGRICYNAGLSVVETTEWFLFFRRSILESVQETAKLGDPNDQDGLRIFMRTVDFFDALLVSTLESYNQQLQLG